MVAAYVVIAAVAIAIPSTRASFESIALHIPFILALALACLVAARATWTRFRLDGTSQSFLFAAAFAGLALVFGPHAFAGTAMLESPSAMMFDPLARLVFAAFAVASLLNLPVPRRLRHPRGALVLLAIGIAVLVEAGAHGSWMRVLTASYPYGYDALRPLEITTLIAYLVVVGVVAIEWRRQRRPFLRTLGQVAFILVVASTLQLIGAPWDWLWWLSHLGLLAASGVLVLGISQQLTRAIGEEELVLHYQPKIDLKTGEICGVEALARWQHPQRGLVAPGEFMPIIEHSDLNGPFTRWALGTALSQHRAWRHEGFDVPVAVNLSPRLLTDRTIVAQIADALARFEVEPSRLHLELTETAFAEDDAQVLRVTGALKRLGVRIAIDDFGTGYSSLTYLRRLPVDDVKIDRSFVQNLTTDNSDLIIVRSTIDLSHELERLVIAEGIEDGPTRDLLVELGCDIGQGYLWSRPVPADELFVWARERRLQRPQ
ncbi:MAG: EAL domain-containing protein [Nitriliruptoraceae bacterium]